MSSLIPERRRRRVPGRAAGTRPSTGAGLQLLVRRQRQALNDITFTIPRHAVTAIIGPSGCGKSTFLRSINRLNELIPGTRHTGTSCWTASRSTRPAPTWWRCASGWGWCSSAQPVPQDHLRQRRLRPALNALVPKRDLPELVERCLRQAALWDEVKDRLDDHGHRASPAASSSGSASRARWPTSPRSC